MKTEIVELTQVEISERIHVTWELYANFLMKELIAEFPDLEESDLGIERFKIHESGLGAIFIQIKKVNKTFSLFVPKDEWKFEANENRYRKLLKREIQIIAKHEEHFGWRISDVLPKEDWLKIRHLSTFYTKKDVESILKSANKFQENMDVWYLSGIYFEYEALKILSELGYSVVIYE